jgi:cyclic beta-1,2-glucan synthetase
MHRYTGEIWFLGLTTLLALIPASEIALTVLNWDVTHFLPPRLLWRMNTADGIPVDAQTFVVVPTIFGSESQVEHLIERLEVHFLANEDEHIYFALLGDFPDAATPEDTNDALLLSTAQSGIDDLNRRHGGNRFHLFHRKRVWNEAKANGWAGNGSAANSKNSIVYFGAENTTFIVRTADSVFKSFAI